MLASLTANRHTHHPSQGHYILSFSYTVTLLRDQPAYYLPLLRFQWSLGRRFPLWKSKAPPSPVTDHLVPLFLGFIFIFGFCEWVCVCKGTYIYMCWHACVCSFFWKLEEDVRLPGAGVTGTCEPLGVGAPNWIGVLSKNSMLCTPNHRALFLSLTFSLHITFLNSQYSKCIISMASFPPQDWSFLETRVCSLWLFQHPSPMLCVWCWR